MKKLIASTLTVAIALVMGGVGCATDAPPICCSATNWTFTNNSGVGYYADCDGFGNNMVYYGYKSNAQFPDFYFNASKQTLSQGTFNPCNVASVRATGACLYRYFGKKICDPLNYSQGWVSTNNPYPNCFISNVKVNGQKVFCEVGGIAPITLFFVTPGNYAIPNLEYIGECNNTTANRSGCVQCYKKYFWPSS